MGDHSAREGHEMSVGEWTQLHKLLNMSASFFLVSSFDQTDVLSSD